LVLRTFPVSVRPNAFTVNGRDDMAPIASLPICVSSSGSGTVRHRDPRDPEVLTDHAVCDTAALSSVLANYFFRGSLRLTFRLPLRLPEGPAPASA
jgi:hypothetical protein